MVSFPYPNKLLTKYRYNLSRLPEIIDSLFDLIVLSAPEDLNYRLVLTYLLPFHSGLPACWVGFSE